MKYVRKLTDHELETLECARKNHIKPRVRSRAHVIILSHNRRQIKDIADICGISRYTVSAIIDNWEETGLSGLYDTPRSGCPRALTPEDEEFVFELLGDECRSVKKIVTALEDQRGKKVSPSTVKRVIKKEHVWKRIRKSLKPKRDEEKFRRAQERIEALDRRRRAGEIEIFYFDGSGFDLTPSVPYAWQPKGERTEVPAAKSRRINVLAFMNKDSECVPFTFECSIDSDAVIACFDSFCEKTDSSKKNFVLIDNAPVHRSKKFLSRLRKWHENGVYPKFLPKYSPELNLIEILWQKMKYEWLPFAAYTSFNMLKTWIDEILLNLGSQYIIDFS
jgi:transposase